MAIIEEHIKSAKYMMRVTAQLLDDYDEHNEQGRRHLLKSALNNVNQIHQQLYTAKLKYEGRLEEEAKQKKHQEANNKKIVEEAGKE